MFRRSVGCTTRNRFAWAVLRGHGDGERLVAVGRYFRAGAGTSAEVALAVVDDYQGRGVGTVLLRALAEHALSVGIASFDGLVLAENPAMRRLLNSTGASLRRCDPGILAFEIDLHDALIRIGGLHGLPREDR